MSYDSTSPRLTDSEYYKLLCGSVGLWQDQASGPCQTQGTKLLIMDAGLCSCDFETQN